MPRQRRWVRACAHDSGDAQGGDPRLPTSCMRRARPELRTDELVVTREAEDGDPPGPETAATGFRMTGKPNTVIPFALTVGEGAAYITIWSEGFGAPFASNLATSASHQHAGSMGPDFNGFLFIIESTVTCGPADECD